MGKRELVALLNLSSWCLVMVEWLFLAVPRDCLRFVIVVFPDHTIFYGLRLLSELCFHIISWNESMESDKILHYAFILTRSWLRLLRIDLQNFLLNSYCPD